MWYELLGYLTGCDEKGCQKQYEQTHSQCDAASRQDHACDAKYPDALFLFPFSHNKTALPLPLFLQRYAERTARMS